MIAALLGLTSAGATITGCGAASAPVPQQAMPDPLDQVEGEELLARANELSEQEDYVRAEQYYVAAMERGVSEDQVMGPLVAACVRSSRFSSALRYAEPYLERHPDAWSLRLLVATMLMGLGEITEARNHLVRIAEDQPTQSVPIYMLAVLHRDALHDPANASQYFQRYLEIAPDGEHAPEARAAIAHPVVHQSEAVDDTTPSVSVTGAPARPVRLPVHDEATEATP